MLQIEEYFYILTKKEALVKYKIIRKDKAKIRLLTVQDVCKKTEPLVLYSIKLVDT